MKQNIAIILSASLLFVFVFAACVTVQASDIICSDGQCQPYDCCAFKQYPFCGYDYGVWYQGQCHCEWTGANPNECAITPCWYGCPEQAED